MGVEIERKYLVREDFPLPLKPGIAMVQGYLPTSDGVSVRARLAGRVGFLTLKGPPSDDGLSRSEFEYPIPVDEAAGIIQTLCGDRIVEKTRYELDFQGQLWEVDLFSGANAGLILAEVELKDAGEVVTPPPWVYREVTGDPRYYNQQLACRPYTLWNEKGH